MAERPSGEIQSFNEDWVATYDPQFALECFWVFGGVDNFIRRQSGDVWQALKRRDFAPVQEISATFEVLKQYLRERMVLTEQGYDLNENIFIVSPHWRELVTRWYEDMGQDAEMMDTFSLYERIRGEWLAELPEHLLAAVDGGHSFKHRTEMAELFGNRSLRVVVGSERAIGESMNWADRQRGLATHVAKTTVIYLGYPWGDAVIEQTGGRFNRPGAPSAYRIMLEMEETIDQGMRLNVLKKRLLKEIVDFGGQLTAEQQEFLRRATTARRVVMGHEATGLTYVTRTLHGLKGRGEAAIMEYMQSPYMGRDHYWGLAVNFWDNGRDQLRQVGRNAKVVVGIAQRLGARMPVDVGCGTALFGRNYPIGTVLSVDLSAEMLRLVAEHYPHVGEVRRGLASDLSAVVQSNSRDFANYAYMLDLTRLYNDDGSSPEDVTEIERVKVLSEMHRILEQGGVAVITLAQSSLDRTTFRNFCNALERHFGFTVMPELSGETYATDLRLRIGWAITVRKTGFVGLDGLNWHDLFLLSDAAETISYPKEENEEEVPQTVFVHVEQPLAEAREFEILNPLTTDSVQLEVAGAQTAPVYPPRYDQLPRIETNGVVHEEVAEEAVEEEVDEVTRYKQTHFDDGSYWRVWNRAVRRLTDEFGDRLVDYGQAERVLHSVLMLEENRGMQQPLNWNQGRFADWAVRQVQRWLDEQENM